MKHSNQTLELVIIGPSGGGKGTQAKKIAQKYDLTHISMGAAFRHEIEAKTELGQKANEYVSQGEWVPTELTIQLLEQELEKIEFKDFILDGFPRLPDQPKALNKLLAKHDQDLELVIHLQVADQVIMKRRKSAWEKGKSFYDQKRKDETMKAIKSRLKAYHDTIEPILNYYREKSIFINIDGERPIEPIFNDIVNQINQHLK
jgi:adenylate kinase